MRNFVTQLGYESQQDWPAAKSLPDDKISWAIPKVSTSPFMLRKQLIVLLRWKSGNATTSLRTASAVKTEINTDIEQHH